MNKNNITIEEMIINEVEKDLGKNVLVDLLNEYLFESLEYNQFEPYDIPENGNLKNNIYYTVNNLKNNVYNHINHILETENILGELNYNYQLIEKLEIFDYNFYSIKLKIDHVMNINQIINRILQLKLIDYLNNLSGETFSNIIELYYYTVSVETGYTMPRIKHDCEISEKNIQLLDEYIINNDFSTALYINGSSIDIDTTEEIPDNINNLLHDFQVICND